MTLNNHLLSYSFISPVGLLTLEGTDGFITTLRFGGLSSQGSFIQMPHVLKEGVKQLEAYFEGHLRCFDLPLSPEGTPFQLRVWSELRKIAFAETLSYRDLAILLGDTKLTRAVGLAIGRNPIPILNPCHRVIGSDGSLTGFSGGLEIKRWLLLHEQRVSGRVLL